MTPSERAERLLASLVADAAEARNLAPHLPAEWCAAFDTLARTMSTAKRPSSRTVAHGRTVHRHGARGNGKSTTTNSAARTPPTAMVGVISPQSRIQMTLRPSTSGQRPFIVRPRGRR